MELERTGMTMTVSARRLPSFVFAASADAPNDSPASMCPLRLIEFPSYFPSVPLSRI